MKSLLAFALLAGCAWGQSNRPFNFDVNLQPEQPKSFADYPQIWLQGDAAMYGGILHLAADQCQTVLKMGNSTRAVKDVFPLECAPPKAVIKMCSGITGECDDPGGSAKGNFGKDLRLQDWQPGVDIVGGQGQKHWRIDWSVPEGVPTPKIGECYQVVDDGERGSELKQVRCRKPQSR